MTNEFVGTGNGELYQELMTANGAFRNLADDINADAFNATQQYTGTYAGNQALIANIDPTEQIQIEQKEKDEEKEATAALVELGEAQQDQREAAELRRHQEAWDNAMSTEYPGLTNKQVLQGLQKICGNINYYSAEAVRQGKIKQDEVPLYKYAFTEKLWLMEQERNGHTNDQEYIRRKQEFETKEKENPKVFEAAEDVVAETSPRNVEVKKDTSHLEANAGTGIATADACEAAFGASDKANIQTHVTMRSDFKTAVNGGVDLASNNPSPAIVPDNKQPSTNMAAVNLNAGMF